MSRIKAHKNRQRDWHPADVVAAVWKRGTSLIRLSRQHGFSDSYLSLALRVPTPKAERIIADFLGMHPSELWPSRYDADGQPKSGLHAHAARSRLSA